MNLKCYNENCKNELKEDHKSYFCSQKCKDEWNEKYYQKRGARTIREIQLRLKEMGKETGNKKENRSAFGDKDEENVRSTFGV